MCLWDESRKWINISTHTQTLMTHTLAGINSSRLPGIAYKFRFRLIYTTNYILHYMLDWALYQVVFQFCSNECRSYLCSTAENPQLSITVLHINTELNYIRQYNARACHLDHFMCRNVFVLRKIGFHCVKLIQWHLKCRKFIYIQSN